MLWQMIIMLHCTMAALGQFRFFFHKCQNPLFNHLSELRCLKLSAFPWIPDCNKLFSIWIFAHDIDLFTLFSSSKTFTEKIRNFIYKYIRLLSQCLTKRMKLLIVTTNMHQCMECIELCIVQPSAWNKTFEKYTL